MISAVLNAFQKFQPRKISMNDSGGNQYKQPYINQNRRRNAGEVVVDVVFDRVIYNLFRNLVKEPN